MSLGGVLEVPARYI